MRNATVNPRVAMGRAALMQRTELLQGSDPKAIFGKRCSDAASHDSESNHDDMGR